MTDYGRTSYPTKVRHPWDCITDPDDTSEEHKRILAGFRARVERSKNIEGDEEAEPQNTVQCEPFVIGQHTGIAYRRWEQHCGNTPEAILWNFGGMI